MGGKLCDTQEPQAAPAQWVCSMQSTPANNCAHPGFKPPACVWGEGLRTIESIDETEEGLQSFVCASRDSWCATQRRSGSKESGQQAASRAPSLAAPPSLGSISTLRARLDQAFSKGGLSSKESDTLPASPSATRTMPPPVDVSSSSLFTSSALPPPMLQAHVQAGAQAQASPADGPCNLDLSDTQQEGSKELFDDPSCPPDMIVSAEDIVACSRGSSSKPAAAKKGALAKIGKKLAKWLSFKESSSHKSKPPSDSSSNAHGRPVAKSLDVHNLQRMQTEPTLRTSSPHVPSSLPQSSSFKHSHTTVAHSQTSGLEPRPDTAAGQTDGALAETAVAAALARAWSHAPGPSPSPSFHHGHCQYSLDTQITPNSQLSHGLSRMSRQMRPDVVMEGEEYDSSGGNAAAGEGTYMSNAGAPCNRGRTTPNAGNNQLLYDYSAWPASSSRRASRDLAPRNVAVAAPPMPGPAGPGGVMGCVRRSLDMASAPPVPHMVRRSMDVHMHASCAGCSASGGTWGNAGGARPSMDMTAPPLNVRRSMDASWNAKASPQSMYGCPPGRYGGLAGTLACGSASGSRRSSFNLAGALSTGGVMILHTATAHGCCHGSTYGGTSPAPSLVRTSTRGLSHSSTRDLSAAHTCPPGTSVMSPLSPLHHSHHGRTASSTGLPGGDGGGASGAALVSELCCTFHRPSSHVRMSGDWSRQYSASLQQQASTASGHCSVMSGSLFSLPTTVGGGAGPGFSRTTTGLSRANSNACCHEEGAQSQVGRGMGRQVSRGDMLHVVPSHAQPHGPLSSDKFDASMI